MAAKEVKAQSYRSPEYEMKFIPKLKVEVLVANEHAEKVFETILKEARTGQLGDGKIYVQDVEKVAGSALANSMAKRCEAEDCAVSRGRPRPLSGCANLDRFGWRFGFS